VLPSRIVPVFTSWLWPKLNFSNRLYSHCGVLLVEAGRARGRARTADRLARISVIFIAVYRL
jgi:hypothetical protein